MAIETYVEKQIYQAKQTGKTRVLSSTERLDGVYVQRGNKSLISFSCNDYLGLSHNPLVKKAACAAIEKYGTSAGASRLVSGNNPLYNELETILARQKNSESCLVFGSGYLVNIGVIPALVGKGDLIVADKLIHSSLIDGCKLSGAKLLRFGHNSIDSCNRILQKHRRLYSNCIIVTERVFSMDGDVAPISELYDLALDHDAWLLTDDAHKISLINKNTSKTPHIQIGTLSKAVGSYGGYVCATKNVIDYLVGSARSLVYSTGLPPATLAASIVALKLISENSTLSDKPIENAKYFTKLLDLPIATSHIVPIIIGDAAKTSIVSNMLEDNGFLVSAIRPPTVPAGTSRLRFVFSALHDANDIEKLAMFIKGMSLK